jgi:hypothetical protein
MTPHLITPPSRRNQGLGPLEMNRAAVAAITTLIALLTGCAEPLIPKPNMDAKPTAFPYPGIYTGTATGGSPIESTPAVAD